MHGFLLDNYCRLIKIFKYNKKHIYYAQPINPIICFRTSYNNDQTKIDDKMVVQTFSNSLSICCNNADFSLSKNIRRLGPVYMKITPRVDIAEERTACQEKYLMYRLILQIQALQILITTTCMYSTGLYLLNF